MSWGAFTVDSKGPFRGATLRQNPDSTWTLRYKEGRTWTFNAAGWLTRQRDRQGNVLLLARDGQNRLTALTDAAGRELTLSYSGTDLKVSQVTDPLGRTVRYQYDGNNRLTQVTDPAGGTWQYTYTAAGHLETVTDPRGIVTEQTTYDPAGRAIRQVQADGGIFQVSYQVVAGTITAATVTDPRGYATTHRFGAGAVGVERTDPQGQRTQSPRDAATTQVTSKTDALGRTTRYTYDGSGNLLTSTDPLDQPRTFTYDPVFNQVTSSTDPLGHVTTFGYDSQGNLLAVTDPEQTLKPAAERLSTTFTYNDAGQPLTVTDPLGQTTRFEYDPAGNLTASIDPLGARTERSHDAVGRLIATTDPLGRVTRYGYDLLDRLVTVTDPGNGVTQFTYDPTGNLLTVTDAKGQTTSHTYDPENRLASRTDALTRSESFTYDGNGNLLTQTDRQGQTTTHTSDATDRRVRTQYADGSFVTFQYDPAGNLLTAMDSQAGSITRAYDPLHRLVGETTPQGSVLYAYDAASRRTQMQPSGLPPVTYGYDANSRLTGVAQGPQIASLTYDPASRRTALTLPNGITVAYQYDEASRLVGQTSTGPAGLLGDLTYHYDATGNRLGTGGSFARSLVPAAVSTSTYDQANRQLTFGATAQTFDTNGNLLTQTDTTGTTTYTWDSRNRLAAINGPTITVTFAYDALGRRVSKVLNGAGTTYLYDGLDVIREAGPNGEASYLRTLAIDEALTRTEGEATMTYLSDLLGSTVALTDPSGSPGTTYSYAPFGEAGVAGAASPNPFQFTGRENDSTGLYYYRARYYDPQRSRFVSEDPLGFGAGINFYAYANLRPTTFRDPLGLETQLCHRPVRGMPSQTHTYLYSTEIGAGWGLGPRSSSAPSLLVAPFICVPGVIEPDVPYDNSGRLAPGHQCTRTEASPCVEQCVVQRARDDTIHPPQYCLGRYQCQDWAEDTLRTCRARCPR